MSLEFYSHRRRLQTEQKSQFWFQVKKEIRQKNGLQGDQIQRFCSVLPLFQRFWLLFKGPKDGSFGQFYKVAENLRHSDLKQT